MYNFDEVVDRHDSNSVKWDKVPDVIPMWVADMDFKAAPFIVDAVRKRVDHGIFGYADAPGKYYDAVIDWFEKRRGWTIEREWITYISGIVPAISVAIDALTAPGDKVIIHTPAYNCFFASIRNNGRICSASPLIYDKSGPEPTFRIDFEDFERRCSDPLASLFLLCNPQNPAGRVWTGEELTRLGEICRRHGVTVVSDEIHCELEMPGYRYTPFAKLCPENKPVTFCSPTKSFNIAGLQIANIIAPDPVMRARIDRTINRFEHCDVNPLGIDALIAAYSPEGETWLKELNLYLQGNYTVMAEYLSEHCPHVKLCKLEGTYLAWIDCKAYTSRGISTEYIQESLITEEKVWINSGTMYGDGDFMRINIACPRETLMEGVSRVSRGLERIWNEHH